MNVRYVESSYEMMYSYLVCEGGLVGTLSLSCIYVGGPVLAKGNDDASLAEHSSGTEMV